MKKLILLLALASGVNAVHAEEYYFAGGIDYTSVEINGESFNPLMSRLKFGVKAVDNRLLRDIGLELVVGQSIADDELAGFTLDLGQHWGVYSTFSHGFGSADFALNVGYSSTDLDTQSSILGNSFSDTIEGFSYGFRYRETINWVPNLRWTFGCTQFFSEDDLSMRGCGLGVSYEL